MPVRPAGMNFPVRMRGGSTRRGNRRSLSRAGWTGRYPDLTRKDRRSEHSQETIGTWAVASCDRLGAARLAGAMWRYWYARGRIGEGRQLLELALDQGPPADPDAEQSAAWARAYGGVGALRHTAGDIIGAKAAYTRSIELWERSGDRRGLSGALVKADHIIDRIDGTGD